MAMSSAMALALVLSAKTDKASQDVDKFANKTLNRIMQMSRKAQDYMKSGLIDIEVGRQLLKPVTDVFNKAVEFEDRMAKAASELGMALGSKEFEDFKKTTLDTAVAMGSTTEEVAKLFDTLVEAGAGKEELSALAQKSADLSKALKITAEEGAKGFLMMRTSLGLTDEQISSSMDLINAATNEFGGKAQNALAVLGKEGSQATKALRFSVKDLVALTNSAAAFGVEGDKTANILNKFHRELAKEGNADLRKIFVDAGGGAQGFIKVLERANKSGNAFAFFAGRGFTRQAGDLQKMAVSLDQNKGLRQQLAFLNQNQSAGSVSKEAADIGSTYSEQMKKFQAQMEQLKITAGTSLLPAVTDFAKSLGPLVQKLADWVKANPGFVKGLAHAAVFIGGMKLATGGLKVAFGAIIGPLGGVLNLVSKIPRVAGTGIKAFKHLRDWTQILGMYGGHVFKSLGGVLIKFGGTLSRLASIVSGRVVKAIMLLGKAFAAVGRAMLTNPIILIIAAIGLAVFMVIKHWDKVKAFFIKLWGHIKTIFNRAWQWIKQMFLNYTPHGLIIKHWDKITAWFGSLWEKVKGLFASFWQWLTGWAGSLKDIGVNLVKAIWEGIKEKWEWLKSKAIKLFEGFKNILGLGKSPAQMAIENNSPVTDAGAQVYRMNAAPQLAPVRGGSNDQFSFAPVINVSGGMDNASAQRLNAQMRRDFEKQMTDYQYNKQRKGF